ncbi:MAG: GNAT family N-acetyltransferase [Firmicutes bacterium]|nr:GNAT family N-acetyltransferase [Dethiobacter sp.]MBS3888073.1 GNAT family N-acetyltransferase [Bacillota bacterium]MBS4053920.1 GNAT family N-acetyltransferase [Thermaerobacter sp.]MBS4055508.1 GNAT family N-acetyltransferase [Thermaerobacter sp.]
MTKGIALALWAQRDELISLWQSAFDDHSESVQYFFDYRFQPENCLVGTVGGRVVSMLHMLPLEVATEVGSVAAHYIYAAATMPAFQGQGYMGALLKAALLCGEWRGQHYSLLLPSNKGLYDFYGRHGYLSCYETKFVTLMRGELEARALGAVPLPSLPNYAELALLRRESMRSHYGAALWDDEALRYAVGYYEHFGGKLVVVEKGQHRAYALGLMGEAETCEVLEMIASQESLPLLAGLLLKELPAKAYRFRLPVSSLLLGSTGETKPFGMIKPLAAGNDASGGLCRAIPYLGLTLD